MSWKILVVLTVLFSPLLLLFLAQGTHIGNYVVWRRSSEVPCGWSAIWPQSNHSLQALFPVGQLQADLSPDEQLRRVLRERLTLFCVSS